MSNSDNLLYFKAEACITALREVPLGSVNCGLKQKIMLHFQHAMATPLGVSPGYFFILNRKMLTSVRKININAACHLIYISHELIREGAPQNNYFLFAYHLAILRKY